MIYKCFYSIKHNFKEFYKLNHTHFTIKNADHNSNSNQVI